MKAKVCAACVIALLLLTLLPTASAQEFYRDKRIRLIVGFPPGGGYDLYTRVIGRHLSRHIPGNPAIIVQNMPGAGSAVAANYLYGPAPQDGTVFGTITPAQVLSDLLGAAGVAFSSEKFNWLVAASSEDVFTCIVNAHLGVKTLDDALKRKQPLVVGGYSPGDFTVMVPQFYKEIIGANLTSVPGYAGTAGIRAAMERKEVDAGCWQWSSIKVTAKAMLDAGAAVVFSQLGPRKAPELPQVANAAERVKAEADRTVMTALFSQLSLGRPYIAPPGVPEQRVRILRKAFTDVLQDPRFLEEANRLNLEVGPLSGEEAQKLVVTLKAAATPILEKLKTIVGSGAS